MHFLALAARAKGPLAFLKRFRSITERYGVTPKKMDQALGLFSEVLETFECGATFPLTTVALKRHPETIANYLGNSIEFGVHGYTHTDYANLGSVEQMEHLRHACEVFEKLGVPVVGFRSPYLRRGTTLYNAISEVGFSYVSNQPIWWDVLDVAKLRDHARIGYERALAFYEPWLAQECLSLPKMKGCLVEIPVSLPDDEILLDRMDGAANGLTSKVWSRIFSQVHERGELFVLQLHPERIKLAKDGLITVLSEARRLEPDVWIARLDEIAAWWLARYKTDVEIIDLDGGAMRLAVRGPAGITILARGVDTDALTDLHQDNYRIVAADNFIIRAPLRPFIGISPEVPAAFIDFLKQQGYILEVSEQASSYACYFNRTDFSGCCEREILSRIEVADYPLVKLGRWPRNACSALSITGDIDALTIFDYILRVLGR